MAKNIKLGNFEPDVTVTIGEHTYALLPYALSVESGLREIQGRLDTINEREAIGTERPDPLEIVETLAEQLDVMLVTAGDAPKPSEVVIEAYKAEKTTRPDIDALCEDLARVISTPPS